MSIDLDTAAQRLNTATDRVDATTQFLADIIEGGEGDTIHNPKQGGQSSPTVKGMVKQHTDEFFAALGADMITDANASHIQEQIIGLNIYPPSTTKTASTLAPYNTCPAGTTALRDAANGKLYKTSEIVEGTITSLNFVNRTATVGGKSVGLLDVGSGGAGVEWSTITGDAYVVRGKGYLMDTSGLSSEPTIKLPASPAIGDMVGFGDYNGSFGVRGCNVHLNGKKFMGQSEDLLLETGNVVVVAQYVDDTVGWKIVSGVGLGGSSEYLSLEEAAGTFSNANLLSNHNFTTSSPDAITHPSATPTDYSAGTQIFSGVFVGTDIVGLTYINGRVSFTSGTLYFTVPNTGSLSHVSALVASVADFDGKPRTRGVSFALVGDEYRVTVGIDALEDDSAALTPLGSVKFEQGSVATGHEVDTGAATKIASFGTIVKVPTDYSDLESAMIANANLAMASSSKVLIVIESGHLLTKGFICRGTNYSHITISSDDAVVKTDASFTGEDPTFIPERLRASVTNPFFCIITENASGPNINFLLDMEQKPVGGMLVAEGFGVVLEGKGFDDCGDRAYLIHGRANLYGAYGRNCAKTSVRTQQAAQVVLRNFDGSGSCTSPDGENQSAIYLSRSTICEMRGSNFSNSGGIGGIFRRSFVTADDANLGGSAGDGIFAESGSMISFSGGQCNNNGGASINCATGAKVLAGGASLGRPSTPSATLNVNSGHIYLNQGTLLNGVAATDENKVIAASNAPYLNAYFAKGLIEYSNSVTPAVGAFDTGSSGSGRYEIRSNGNFETQSTTVVYDVTIASGAFSGQIPLPAVPLPSGFEIDEITFFNIEAVGRTSAGGGGNRVAVQEFNRFPSDGTGNEFKIKNEGVQLDGTNTGMTVNSVEFQIKINGRWRRV